MWNLEKTGYEEPRGRTGIKTHVENGLEDTGGGGRSWGKVRVAWTYIHYQM